MRKNISIVNAFESKSIVVLLLTVCGYVAAYMFSAGYLARYEISQDFIDINVTSIIYSICILFFITALVYALWSIVLKLTEKLRSGVSIAMRLALLMLTLLTVLGALGFNDWLYFLLIILLCCIGMLVGFSTYLWKYKNLGLAWQAYKEKSDGDSPLFLLYGNLPTNIVQIIGQLLVIGMIAYLSGLIWAGAKPTYTVIDTNDTQKTLVIYKTNSLLLTKIYDSDTKRFMREYSIVEMQSVKNAGEYNIKSVNKPFYINPL